VWHGARSLPRRRVGVSSGAPYQPRRDPPRQVAHHRALLLDRPLNERVQLQLAIDLCHGTRETRRARSYLDTRHLRERSPPPPQRRQRRRDEDRKYRRHFSRVFFADQPLVSNARFQDRARMRTAEGEGRFRGGISFKLPSSATLRRIIRGISGDCFRGGTKGGGVSKSRVEETIRIVMRLVLIL